MPFFGAALPLSGATLVYLAWDDPLLLLADRLI